MHSKRLEIHCTQTAYMASLFYTKSSLHLLHCTKRFSFALPRNEKFHCILWSVSLLQAYRNFKCCENEERTSEEQRIAKIKFFRTSEFIKLLFYGIKKNNKEKKGNYCSHAQMDFDCEPQPDGKTTRLTFHLLGEKLIHIPFVEKRTI